MKNTLQRVLLSLLLWISPAMATDILWTQFIATIPIHEPFTLFTEFQPRWSGGLKNSQVVLLRGALLYRISPELRVGLGYGMMPQFQPFVRNESRLFEQLEWMPSLEEKVPALSRTRLEQRWLENAPGTGWRLREKLQVSWMPSAVGLYVWNELFYNLNGVDGHLLNGFDQNRFSIGPRYKKDSVTFEAGYLLQALRNTSDVTVWNAGAVLSLVLAL